MRIGAVSQLLLAIIAVGLVITLINALGLRRPAVEPLALAHESAVSAPPETSVGAAGSTIGASTDPGGAPPRPPLLLQSIGIGFSEAEILKAHPRHRVRCYQDKGIHRHCTVEKPVETLRDVFVPVFSLELSESDTVVRVEKEYTNDRFELLVDGAIHKFGAPDSDQASAVQNRMGASFDQRVLTWRGAGEIMTLEQRGSEIGLARFTLTRLISQRELDESRAAKAREVAESL